MRLSGFKHFFVAEARQMVRDPNKPVAVHNVVGWQVYFYDEEQELHDRSTRRLSRYRDRIVGAIDNFLQTYPDEARLKEIAEYSLNNALARNHRVKELLDRYGHMNVYDLGGDIMGEINSFVSDDLFSAILDAASLHHDDAHTFKLHDFITAQPLEFSLSAQEVVSSAYEKTFLVLPRFFEQVRKNIDSPPSLTRVGKADPQTMIAKHLPAVRDTLIALEQLGLRSVHKVPIRIHIVTQHPGIFGTTDKKAGDADPGQRWMSEKPTPNYTGTNTQDTQRVNVYLTATDSPEEVNRIITHEVGHILFNSSPELQRMVQDMSHQMPPPSAYGDVGHVYGGSSTPAINHKSGNEWFAEMLVAITTGKTQEFTPAQIMGFKRMLGRIGQSSHPHSGMSYRIGQDQPGYQFPQQKWQPPVPDINQPTLPTDQPRTKPGRRRVIVKKQW